MKAAPEPNGVTKPKSVLYCRVSDPKQKTHGHGLTSQEHRCRQYAAEKGYAVEMVFADDVTGGGSFLKRPSMMAMLAYLKKHASEPHIVIFDDLKRFARDTMFHLQLRQELAAVNASVECLNFTFEDTPEGEFIETIVAAQGQLERQQMARQTLQKMQARIEQGYWVFPAPVGYRFKEVNGQGKLLVRDEPLAGIVQEALEGYASGRFQLQAEVQRFLESFPEFPRDGSEGGVRAQRVTNLLTRVIYAGYIEKPEWNVSLRPAQHEGLISFEDYQKIQQRLKGNAYVPARKNLNEEFPLRGFVACGSCGHPMTAGFSKGMYQKYPYYLCRQKGCESYGKSIRRDALEGDFAKLLRKLKPTEGLYKLVREMIKEPWNHRLAFLAQHRKHMEIELQKTDRNIELLLDRIVEADSGTAIPAYEKRIKKLEADKIELQEKIERAHQPVRGFDETFRTAMSFLANPCNLWESDRLEDKRAVLRLVFADRLRYVKNEGFRTVKTTLPFKVLGDFPGRKCAMVPRDRIELPTRGFSVPCSTN